MLHCMLAVVSGCRGLGLWVFACLEGESWSYALWSTHFRPKDKLWQEMETFASYKTREVAIPFRKELFAYYKQLSRLVKEGIYRRLKWASPNTEQLHSLHHHQRIGSWTPGSSCPCSVLWAMASHDTMPHTTPRLTPILSPSLKPNRLVYTLYLRWGRKYMSFEG